MNRASENHCITVLSLSWAKAHCSGEVNIYAAVFLASIKAKSVLPLGVVETATLQRGSMESKQSKDILTPAVLTSPGCSAFTAVLVLEANLERAGAFRPQKQHVCNLKSWFSSLNQEISGCSQQTVTSAMDVSYSVF